MSTLERIKNWLRMGTLVRHDATEPLREFVYLDEVSLYSLLASRRKGIATQFSQSQTTSLNNELGSALKVGFGGIAGGVDSKTQTSESQASQVIRKATVQDSFKELHDIEKNRLCFASAAGNYQRNVKTRRDIEKEFKALAKSKLIVDMRTIKRGDLLEANVELEADPLFRMTMVITTLYELMADRSDIFGTVPATQIEQAYSVGQVLDRLLSGLVPIRGRLIDYESTTMGDREVLVHRAVKDQVRATYTGDFRQVYITGVAQQGLFWKDMRQILFSESQYTVFCRLATPDLRAEWQPVKIVDLFEGIIPEFKEAIDTTIELARQLMERPRGVEANEQLQNGHLGIGFIREYVHQLEDFHGEKLNPQLMEDSIMPIVPLGDWHASVTERRAVFDEVTKLVDDELGKETPGDTRLSLRQKVLGKIHTDETSLITTLIQSAQVPTKAQAERILDTEIVAIYW